MTGAVEWTAAELAVLRREWANGLSAQQIARQIATECRGNRSRNAVIGKVHRMGLAGRLSPLAPAKRERAARARAARIRAVVPPKMRASPTPTRGEEMARIAALQPVDPSLGVSRLNSFTCHYPIGNPDEPSFAFCGRTCSLAGPYCADHTRLAYMPVKQRQEAGLKRLATWLDNRHRQPNPAYAA